MARKSAVGLVTSQMIPVDPDGEQPTYIRSKRSIQTSSKLRAHQTCVADELKGQNFSSRADVREAFKSASQDCSN